MAYEDFTAYTEVDPNNNVAVTPSSIVHQVRRDEDAYIYGDFGAGYFDDLVLYVTVEYSGAEPYTYYCFCVFSDELDDVKGLRDGARPYLGLYFYDTSFLVLDYFDGASNTQDTYVSPAFNTPYYLVISRANDLFTCKIFSDEARTTLIDTLQVNVSGSSAYRYLLVTDTYNSGDAIEGTLRVSNLDLCPFTEWRSPTSSWQASCGEYTLCWNNLGGIWDDDLETATYLDGYTFNDPADLYVKWDPPILMPNTLRLWYTHVPASIYNSINVLYDPGGWTLITSNGFSGSPMDCPLDSTKTISEARISVTKIGWGWELRGDLMYEIKILDGIPCSSSPVIPPVARTYFFLA